MTTNRNLATSKKDVGLVVELLKEDGRENYTVIGYLNIEQPDGAVLVRILERFPYIINYEAAILIYTGLKKDWNLPDEEPDSNDGGVFDYDS